MRSESAYRWEDAHNGPRLGWHSAHSRVPITFASSIKEALPARNGEKCIHQTMSNSSIRDRSGSISSSRIHTLSFSVRLTSTAIQSRASLMRGTDLIVSARAPFSGHSAYM